MIVRLLLMMGCALPLGAATVTHLDGANISGPLQLVELGIESPRGVIPWDQCDWLLLGEPVAASAVARTEPLGLSLVDGSWLPVDRLAAAPTGEAILVSGPFGDLTVPLTAILGWAAGPLPAAGEGDQLLVASGPLRGQVQGLREGRLVVATGLDPVPLTLAVGEVLALRLAQPSRPPLVPALLVTTSPRRPPLRLTVGATPALAAAPGVRVEVQALSGLRVTVESPRRVWLSDLTPTTVEESGAFGVVWPYRRDTDLDGAPIMLGGTQHAKGVTIHSQATIGWNVAGEFVRLRAVIGIIDALGPEGDCDLIITGDGRELWKRSGIRGGQPPIPLDVDVGGIKALSLTVAYGRRYDIGDHLVLADAALIRR